MSRRGSARGRVVSRSSSQSIHVASSTSVKRIGGSRTSFASSRASLFSSSRQLLTSGSRKSFDKTDRTQQNKPPVQIIVNGVDMTPRDILQVDQSSVKRNQSNVMADLGASMASESLFQQSLYGGPVGTSFSQPFTRSVLGSSRSSPESSSDALSAPSSFTDIPAVTSSLERAQEDISQPLTLTASDIESVVDINLTESDTIWLFDMPGTCVALDGDEAQSVIARNEQYTELCKNRAGNDWYAPRAMQTFNDSGKVKHVQTVPVVHNDVGVMATNWDMYDTYEATTVVESTADADTDEDVVPERRPGSVTSKTSRSQRSRSVSMQPSSMLSSESKASCVASGHSSESSSIRAGIAMMRAPDSGSPELPEEIVIDPILKSDELKETLKVMERVVTLNIYQNKQATYRGLAPIEDNTQQGKPPTPTCKPLLERLWTYVCPLTADKTVCSMAWNKSNNDLLVVGYGQFEYTEQKPGLVCCWSLKNPEFPERIFHTDRGVTAVDFSRLNPNLLAVGLYDGTIAIYNVRSSDSTPVLNSSKVEGKHSSPIWQLKWIDKERVAGEDKTEVLVSIATDGRVVQWSIRKGCECFDLMHLKRTSKKGRKGMDGSIGRSGKQSEALIARHACGQTFDFVPSDTNMYLAGTEEGHIHKCSCSYNEQYLESYFGHTGPVYRIAWSPFLQGCFASCSADWSVRLWHESQTKPVCTFQSSNKATYDLGWSPTSPGVLASVSDGRVDVWNFAENSLDPVIVHEPASSCAQSCLLFSLNSNALLVGDSQGQVTVYELRNVSNLSADEQAGNLGSCLGVSANNRLAGKVSLLPESVTLISVLSDMLQLQSLKKLVNPSNNSS